MNVKSGVVTIISLVIILGLIRGASIVLQPPISMVAIVALWSTMFPILIWCIGNGDGYRIARGRV